MLTVQLLAIRELPWFRNRLEKILFNNLFVIDSRFRLCGVEAWPKMYQKFNGCESEDWQKSWRETGRSWTTGIGRPPSLSRSPTGERGGGAACCSSFYCFLFSSVIPVKIGDFDQILICLDENLSVWHQFQHDCVHHFIANSSLAVETIECDWIPNPTKIGPSSKRWMGWTVTVKRRRRRKKRKGQRMGFKARLNSDKDNIGSGQIWGCFSWQHLQRLY